jgi:signal transduction histidine kinase
MILFIYTYASFFQIPYVGFDFDPVSGEIVEMYVEPVSGAKLMVGDYLLKVGSVSWSAFRANSTQLLFEDTAPGETVPIEILRNSQPVNISWVIPGVTSREFLDRLINVWWLAYVFWLAGAATLLLVRPKDIRWKLLISANYLTAVWLIAGNVSTWQIWHSTILMRAALWLCVPVYLHLHWVLPKRLTRIPKPIIWSLYLLALMMVLAEWLQLLPRSAFFNGFVIAIAGSIVILFLHVFFQPNYRRETGLLISAQILGVLPAILISLTRWSGGILLTLPLIPLMYFYTIYRRQLSGLELRANRFISGYLFLILLGLFFIFIIPIINNQLNFPFAPVYVGVVSALHAIIITLIGFPYFERFINRRLLGIPLAPTHLLEIYASRITTSMDFPSLVYLLRNEILPSLLVRQSALLRFDDNGRMIPLYLEGVDITQLPSDEGVSEFRSRSGEYRPSLSEENDEDPFSWVRLPFSLEVEGSQRGLWLLGRRDPDDVYAIPEISVLRTIANQTAIAIVNITQAERLRSLYQLNIDRHEDERASLARDLHDDVLNQLTVLAMNVDQSASPDFEQNYRKVISSIRQLINGLRPAMLNFGLHAALEELADELSDRAGEDILVSMEIPPTNIRYELRIEEYIYRIVQQAGENALKHAQASTIRIWGALEPERLALNIDDDGIGFSYREQMDFGQLQANRRFGLTGMTERAKLIGACLRIESMPGRGTHISVIWPQEKGARML